MKNQYVYNFNDFKTSLIFRSGRISYLYQYFQNTVIFINCVFFWAKFQSLGENDYEWFTYTRKCFNKKNTRNY